MNTVYLGSDETSTPQMKFCMDDLFERQRIRDEKQVKIFNAMLNRLYKQIRFAASRSATTQVTHVFFTVPPFIFGETTYNDLDCLAYLIHRLQDSGFYVKHLHPRTLFVSWHTYIPKYVRTEIKKKRGIVIDEKGTILETPESILAEDAAVNNPNSTSSAASKYKSIKAFVPDGSLVYNPSVVEKMETRITELQESNNVRKIAGSSNNNNNNSTNPLMFGLSTPSNTPAKKDKTVRFS